MGDHSEDAVAEGRCVLLRRKLAGPPGRQRFDSATFTLDQIAGLSCSGESEGSDAEADDGARSTDSESRDLGAGADASAGALDGSVESGAYGGGARGGRKALLGHLLDRPQNRRFDSADYAMKQRAPRAESSRGRAELLRRSLSGTEAARSRVAGSDLKLSPSKEKAPGAGAGHRAIARRALGRDGGLNRSTGRLRRWDSADFFSNPNMKRDVEAAVVASQRDAAAAVAASQAAAAAAAAPAYGGLQRFGALALPAAEEVSAGVVAQRAVRDLAPAGRLRRFDSADWFSDPSMRGDFEAAVAASEREATERGGSAPPANLPLREAVTAGTVARRALGVGLQNGKTRPRRFDSADHR